MRVNMDSSVASDPRFKLVAAALGVKYTEVIGSCFLLWLSCYERRSERLRKVEADVASGLSGFADALVAEDLADDCDDGTIIVHGVTTRIEFLKKQAERGSKGGKSKKKPPKKANAKQTLPQPPSTDDQSAQAYTLTLTPPPPLTPTPDLSLEGAPKVAPTPTPRRNRSGPDDKLVADTARTVVAAFNNCFERNLGSQGSEAQVKALLARGYTEPQMRAVMWWAGEEWGRDDEWRMKVTPTTMLKLTSSAGSRTFPQYLDLASELWRETKSQLPPWEEQA